MIKRGEADVAITFLGALAEELRRTPGLAIKPTYMPWTQWLSFNAEPWDAKSPWRDQRVRRAANLAIDRPAINQALFLGLSKVTASIIPQLFDFSWAAPAYPYDPAKSKQLLAEAGYPSGFDGGTLSSDLVYASFAEAAANYLAAVGVRVKLTPMERAAHTKALQEKKIKGLSVIGTASFGNAATRIEAYVAGSGSFAWGSHADLDGLFQEQSTETDKKRREATLVKIQQTMHDRALFVPLLEPALLNGYGPRVAESGLGLISGLAYSAPYEDVRLKK
jgi:ABC-type transport system substrate-binding protein